MIVFACLAPHPPLLLPGVGSEKNRLEVKKTIRSLEELGQELAKSKPDLLIVSSPHPDWGFNVPLFFLNKNLKNTPVQKYLTNLDSPKEHFKKGIKIIEKINPSKRIGWIASGDMSHRLAKDGPYGLHPSGPKFDEKFIGLLKKKDVGGILNLSPILIDEAGECGLRSFCILLGALEKEKSDWRPKILSYEAPFGVGYLTARLI